MAKERKTITVTKPNQQAKMGVTVTKTGYSPIFVSGLTTNGVGAVTPVPHAEPAGQGEQSD